MSMSPLEIEVLLHYYYTPSNWDRRSNVSHINERFLQAGLIEKTTETDSGYKCTDRGRAHVIQICELEFPNLAFVNSHNEIIDI